MRYEFKSPDRFIVGTVGEPGERAFFIQVKKESRCFSVAVEKEQVRAIFTRLELLISEIRKADPLEILERVPSDDAPLDSPVESLFEIGAISLFWDDAMKMVCCELYELKDDEEESEGESLAVYLSLGLAQAFCSRSKAVVNAGRLPCPFCAIPIDPRGHLCPRANGYRR